MGIRELALVSPVGLLLLSCGASPSSPSPGAASGPPATPALLAPANRTVFDHYPRTTTLVWTSVPGAVAYQVEVEFCQPPECVDGETAPLVYDGASIPTYTFEFVGRQPGRWRISAIGANGLRSPKTGWWIFYYSR